MSSNFQESYAEYDTNIEGMTGEPRQLVWCGNDTLVMNWEGLVLMVGPYGSVLRSVNFADGGAREVRLTLALRVPFDSYYYSSPTVLISEHDGVRVLSSDRCDFLQKVPSMSLCAVFVLCGGYHHHHV